MNLRLLFSTFCLSTLYITIGFGKWIPTQPSISTNAAFYVAQAADEQNQSPPGGSRGEERRYSPPQTFFNT